MREGGVLGFILITRMCLTLSGVIYWLTYVNTIEDKADAIQQLNRCFKFMYLNKDEQAKVPYGVAGIEDVNCK